MKLNYRLCVFVATISLVLVIVYFKNTFVPHNLNFLGHFSTAGQIKHELYINSDRLLKNEVNEGISRKTNEPLALGRNMLIR